MASSTSPPTRIRVRTPEDIDLLYSLIINCDQNPDWASNVTYFVLRCHIRQELYLGGKSDLSKEWKAREDAREPVPDSPMWRAVRHLGLGAREEEEWTKVLTWMQPDLVAARQAALEALGGESFRVEPYVRHRNSVFAQYAAAVLLTLCPAIETMVCADSGQHSPVEQVLRRINGKTLPGSLLLKLRTVFLLPDDDWAGSDERYYGDLDILQKMRLFHRLPSIEMVSADAASPNNDRGFEDSIPPASSDLKIVRMTHVSLPSTLMATQIRMPKALAEFTCTIGGRASLGGGHYLVFPETIGKALWGQRSSLIKLDLDVDQHISRPHFMGGRWLDGVKGDSDEEYGDGRHAEDSETSSEDGQVKTADLQTGRSYNQTIGSLHDFEQLTHLTIGVQSLLGPRPLNDDEPAVIAPFRLIEALPQSLKYLLIRGYVRGQDSMYDGQIDELLTLKSERLPRLRTVEGVQELVPCGKDVRHPDDNYDQLWKAEIPEDW